MAISRSQLVKELEPGLNALFGLEYGRYDAQHAEIFETETSDRAFEEEVMLSGFGNARTKSEGGSIVYDNATETFTARYTHETIALGFAITEEAVEDNLYDRISAMANTKQVKAANVLNNGFDNNFPGGDGVALLSTAHPLVAGTLRNELTTPADLNEASLEQSLIDIAAFVDERGLLISTQGRKLIVPSELQFVADRLTESAFRPGTADNDVNAHRNMGMIPEGYTVNNYLTDPDAFFIKTDIPNGFKLFQRSPIRTSMEGDFDTGNVRYKARERYSFGFSDPRCVFGSPGA
jgi:hypothetical protein